MTLFCVVESFLACVSAKFFLSCWDLTELDSKWNFSQNLLDLVLDLIVSGEDD